MEKVALDIQEPVLTEADLATPVADVRAEAAQKTKEDPAGVTDQQAASLETVADPGGIGAAAGSDNVAAASNRSENNPGFEDSQHDTFPGEGEVEEVPVGNTAAEQP
eukprot:10406584-Karenia_brevis.AAC.1